MTTQTTSTATETTFTPAERQMLRTLRTRFRQDRDLFTEGERTCLQFVRWLYQTGRLVP